MKIAIKTNPNRGKDIIKILSDLGGRSSGYNGNGTIKSYCYFIDENNYNRIEYGTPPSNYKIYTLEEFERKFPFKVGDIVKTKQCGESAEVIKLYPNPACIISYKVRYKSGKEMQHCPENIKFYKEMKEERNITLTLEKAKEWYKKGGELKEIALQAFSEKELNPLPRNWEEFCEKYSKIDDKEYFIDSNSSIIQATAAVSNYCRLQNGDRNICPSEKSAEAHLAMIQLEQLRDCWRQGWVQTPTDAGYRINKTLTGDYVVMSVGSCKYFLSFPTYEMTKEFLECFRDLIKKAGDLI